jgi:hypothetical protein
MTTRWIRPEVSRGIALLTQHYGPQWHQMIDLRLLDMGHGIHRPRDGHCGCIGAQVNAALHRSRYGGEFQRAMAEIGLDEQADWERHGFYDEDDHPALDFEWRYAILCLRDPVRAGYRGPLERPQP